MNKNILKMAQHSLNTIISSGKYEGETTEEILSIDPGYIIFLYRHEIIKPDSELLDLIKIMEGDRIESFSDKDTEDELPF